LPSYDNGCVGSTLVAQLLQGRMKEGIMLTLLDAEEMKKDQLYVENTDGVSPYFNKKNSKYDLAILPSHDSQHLVYQLLVIRLGLIVVVVPLNVHNNTWELANNLYVGIRISCKLA